MSNGALIRLLEVAPSAVTASSAAAAFPDDNLVHVQPKVVWQTAAIAFPASVTLTVDLGADTPIDAVALLFGNFSAAATWEVRAATAAQGVGQLANTSTRILGFAGATTMRAPVASRVTRFHALAAGASVSRRYVRVIINETAANTEGLLRAGILAIGQRWMPFWNFEWGGGRRIDDLSDRRVLPGGEVSTYRRAKVPIVRATWGDLTADEMVDLWALLQELGESERVIFVENFDVTAGLHEGIGYGVFEGTDFFDRQQLDKIRIELRVRHAL